MSSVSERRRAIEAWLSDALDAVDPERLTRDAARSSDVPPEYIVAIGKAAAGMCRGAVAVFEGLPGVCVTNEITDLPKGLELLIGEHPVPGDGSFMAGRRLLDFVRLTTGRGLALISGGGSALCEWPRQGITRAYVEEADRRVLMSGEPIERANLLRGHLSAIKSGGLARAASRPMDTLILSDVSGADPGIVASGPTIPGPSDPHTAIEILGRLDMEVTPSVRDAVSAPRRDVEIGSVEVIGDGLTAARTFAARAEAEVKPTAVSSGWLSGDVADAVGRMLETAVPGVTIAAGETSVAVSDGGRGGRNTHAALLAARHLEGTDAVFAAFATDGVDGASEAAGAIVDGQTVSRGGDPSRSLSRFDSATYLERTGDLIRTGPTGTNVADLWVVWNP